MTRSCPWLAAALLAVALVPPLVMVTKVVAPIIHAMDA